MAWKEGKHRLVIAVEGEITPASQRALLEPNAAGEHNTGVGDAECKHLCRRGRLRAVMNCKLVGCRKGKRVWRKNKARQGKDCEEPGRGSCSRSPGEEKKDAEEKPRGPHCSKVAIPSCFNRYWEFITCWRFALRGFARSGSRK